MVQLGRELQYISTTEFEEQPKSMQERENTTELRTDLVESNVRIKTSAQKLVLVMINVWALV